MRQKRIRQDREGSISIFLAFLFILLMALTGTLLDSGRYFGAGGYMNVSAHAAGRNVFGNYNKELYQEYHLFGYGGYDGRGIEQWRQEFLDVLAVNISSTPPQYSEKYFGGKYSKGMYGIDHISAQMQEVHMLSEKKQFVKQIKQWMKTKTIRGISSSWKKSEQSRGTLSADQIAESLEQTRLMEEGKLEEKEEGEKKEEQEEKDNTAQPADATQKKDEAGGNPLEFLKEFVQDGLLSMVCNPAELSEEAVEGETQGVEKNSWNKEAKKEQTAAEILKSVLNHSNESENEDMTEVSTQKGILMAYAGQVFGRYDASREASMRYEMEYLICGKNSDKDNLSCIVDRLMAIRTLINYSYVHKDPEMLEKSMATAEAIVTVTQTPALLKAVQETILLILSLEESCVDICALLQGRIVPITKTVQSFQMHYGEICLAGSNLFESKAKNFPLKKQNTTETGHLEKGMDYSRYLWMFLSMVPENTLFARMKTLIQDDLQKRYNGTFDLESCICEIRGNVTFQMPYLFRIFWKDMVKPDTLRDHSVLQKKVSFHYAYH